MNNNIRVIATQKFDHDGLSYERGSVYDLPRALGLQLLSLKKVKDHPVKIRFKTSVGPYNGGEVAGFPPEQANIFVLKRQVAVFEDDFQKAEQNSTSNPAAITPNVDIKNLIWHEAKKVVEACSNLQQLEAWQRDGETRMPVVEAIQKRLGELSGQTSGVAAGASGALEG